MPRAWLPVSLFLALLLVGCGPKLQQFGGQPPKSVPMNVISLSPSTTEILALDGQDMQLRGRTAFCNYPTFVSGMPVYGGVKPDYEKLKEAHPDLVVLDDSLYSSADIAKLKELGCPLYEFHATSVKDFEHELRELSALTVSSLKISQYIDKINSEINAAHTTTSKTPPKVAALSGSLVAGSKSFIADVIRQSGGDPIGPDADRFTELNPETLIQANPDIILCAVDISKFSGLKDKPQETKAAVEQVDKIMNDPRYKNLKAVTAKHVFPVDADVMLRAGARVDLLIHAIAAVVDKVGE
ncbi:MAG TPA: helical backbone metal receptor [Fimbriimonadaceae bacterium]|nr:helical backbone metal receptor [Fimbriimonadaceae bacterium]